MCRLRVVTVVTHANILVTGQYSLLGWWINWSLLCVFIRQMHQLLADFHYLPVFTCTFPRSHHTSLMTHRVVRCYIEWPRYTFFTRTRYFPRSRLCLCISFRLNSLTVVLTSRLVLRIRQTEQERLYECSNIRFSNTDTSCFLSTAVATEAIPSPSCVVQAEKK